jgi:hypothetical protein
MNGALRAKATRKCALLNAGAEDVHDAREASPIFRSRSAAARGWSMPGEEWSDSIPKRIREVEL